MEEIRKTPKLIEGIVSKKNTEKTAVLSIDYTEQHKLYKKYIRRTKTLVFHDENNECKVGDKVAVMETRPLSKSKRHRLVRVAQRFA